MDVATITQLIQGVGFPIVCAGALFWYIVKDKNDRKEERNEDRKYRKEERESWQVSLNNNTSALEKLAERIGGNDNG